MEKQLTFDYESKAMYEAKIKRLEAENKRLRELSNIKSNHDTTERRLIPLYPEEWIEFLFSYQLNRDTGEITTTDVPRSTILHNHERWISAIFETALPKAKRQHNTKNKFGLTSPTMHDFNEKQWKVACKYAPMFAQLELRLKNEMLKLYEKNKIFCINVLDKMGDRWYHNRARVGTFCACTAMMQEIASKKR